MSYKKRTEAVQNEAPKELITVRIDRLVDKPDSSLLAIASINIADSFAVHGIKVMEGEKGLFVSMPSNSYTDRNGNTQYVDICHPITAVARTGLIDKVVDAYHQKVFEEQAAAQKGVGQSIGQ